MAWYPDSTTPSTPSEPDRLMPMNLQPPPKLPMAKQVAVLHTWHQLDAILDAVLGSWSHYGELGAR